MRRQCFIVKPYSSTKKPHLKWQVEGYVNGKRTRRFAGDDGNPFTKAQADQYAHLKNLELDQHGREATKLSTYDRVIAQKSIAELAPFGLNLQDAVRFAIERAEARRKSAAIEIVCDQYLECLAMRRLSRHHILGVRRLLNRLTERFAGMPISDITTIDLENFLNQTGPEWSARSRNQHRSKLTGLWAWAGRQGYCEEKIARYVGWIKPKEARIGILSLDEIARLMSTASPKMIAGYAIGLWAGLRVEEICRLDWIQIRILDKPDARTGTFGRIQVLPENAKSARNRFVPILPNLAAWLRPFAKSSGPVVVPRTSQYFDELRQIDQLKAGIPKWPNNALRHSFASYHYRYFQNQDRLIAQMGHAGPQLIFAHYCELVTPEDAAPFWELAPFSRPELTKIHALTAEAYPWYRTVGRVIDRDYICGVRNLAHYFGGDYSLAYYWFNHIDDCPPRPADDRFYIPTWRAFVARHPEWRSNRYHCEALFYVSWYPNDRSGEQRIYFARLEDAVKRADADNRRLLGNEVQLDEVRNIIDFAATSSIAIRTAQSPLEHPTTETANIVG